MRQRDSVGTFDFAPEIAAEALELHGADGDPADSVNTSARDDRAPAKRTAITLRLRTKPHGDRLATFDRGIAAHV